MMTCKKCLYSKDHPLHLIIDEEGVCSGCRIHEEKDFLDWTSRENKLKSILEDFKNKSNNNYDCIIPVSGARDSYFIVHMVKNIYGLNPLLVTYNKHYNTALGIRNLANLRLKFDCDLMTLTVNPETVKKITRATLRKFGSIYWHCLAGQTVYPVQVAVKHKIPLIIWGAHQGLDQVGMFSHLDEVEMTRKYRKEHDLMGYEAEDLIDEFDNISQNDIIQFKYPEDKEIERVGVRGIYLNNYIRWDSRKQHEIMISKYGYKTSIQTRTFDNYNDTDCWVYSDLHDYIKFLKYGYGKVVDHACREIRLNHMTREQASALVDRYIHKKPVYSDLFFAWLGISENAFNFLIDQHRNKSMWFRNDNWEWELKKYNFSHEIPKQNSIKQEPFHDFLLTKNDKTSDLPDKYILIGKGV
ncbi:N-acetyl sugar amidotransferase [Akkermansiaceae bacterium]|nr:N-acetyl sugar amidotransferase [Akkermansiaceae bacterium]